MLGAGGLKFIDPLYQKVVVQECRGRGIPIVFDEVCILISFFFYLFSIFFLSFFLSFLYLCFCLFYFFLEFHRFNLFLFISSHICS